jgi:Domain of unknown function (DUF5911)
MSATANSRGSRRSADGGSAEAAVPQSAARPESAAVPSPFTPIANYGFLSNCHTGALVAPDGTVDWLCVPRFDSPSVFGALLDRGAGGFRFGPFGINVTVATLSTETGSRVRRFTRLSIGLQTLLQAHSCRVASRRLRAHPYGGASGGIVAWARWSSRSASFTMRASRPAGPGASVIRRT